MTSTDFFVSLSIYDPKNGRHVFFKTDGKRFEEDRTIKISCDAKYDLTVTVRPPGIENLTLLKLRMGSDEITPDKKTEESKGIIYSLSWFTNGYKPTKKGARNDLRIGFKFAQGELIFPAQVKFYPLSDSTHVVWGTVMKSIDLESTGNFQPGASPHQRFPLKRASIK
ncbi:PREDICTED: CB1 cannabinoid receptor-interacting protein 1-like [Amphimedon queenslandica]|uniref:CB1 cannabinoid receptor-interacting protein 1 n=1 Tax=Amphimedon queenslandica TaxID=400682 RepID=A0A1X7VL75_AMPQE|nr:PREDICTED: CB1 cannabinoid receptor-interacting protein 1-like [Amphimedon queenslandica]|eukprot:XP_003383766.1 PREDICTED: CB1 cannabinoid receptor-interacting protein 1-like [Amphimedon queenslandica]